MQLFIYLLITCLLISVKAQNASNPFIFYNGAFIKADPNRIFFESGTEDVFISPSGNVYQSVNRPGSTNQPGLEEQVKAVRPTQNFSYAAEPSLNTVKLNEESYVDLKNKSRPSVIKSNLNPNVTILHFKDNQTTGNFKNNAVDIITNFSINLFQKVNKLQPENIVISPYSITMLLALLQQGAKESTLEQINTALKLSSFQSADIYQRITEDVLKRNSQNILKVANNIFVSDSFNINPGFQKIATNNFKSEITQTAFIRPDLAARFINSWVANKTDNKIDKLLSPDVLSENTQLVLVNAVYFKGLWQIPFRPESTLSRPFEVSRGIFKSASYMRTRRYFKTGVDAYTGSKIIILPFELDQYSLMIILPSQLSNVDKDLSLLSVAQLSNYHNFTAKDVALELPKFTVKADVDLVPVFTKLGITNIFSERSELYGLGTYRSSSPQVSSALHSALLSIDEKGGSAAAATAFNVVTLSYDEPSVKFIVNRPFIAVLWDSASSLPLFMAKIVDPVF